MTSIDSFVTTRAEGAQLVTGVKQRRAVLCIEKRRLSVEKQTQVSVQISILQPHRMA